MSVDFIYGAIFLHGKGIKIYIMIYFSTDKMVSIRNIEYEKIIPPFDEGGILLVSIDKISIVSKDISENCSTSVNTASGWS